jgi:hypothetical protein
MKYFSAFIFITLFSCTSKSGSDFSKFCQSVPDLTFPVEIDCQKDQDYYMKDQIDDSLGFKYCTDHWQINGELALNRNYKTLIYSYPGDFMYPSVFTFSSEGNFIDSLNLGTSCGEWHGNIEHAVIRIKQDGMIHFIDSLIVYDVDSNDNIIRGTGQAKIKLYNYQIDDKGYFKMVLEKTDTTSSVY